MKSKKAVAMMYIVLVGFILGFSFAFLNISKAVLEREAPYLGYNSEVLMNTYQRAQEHLLFVDVAAKISSERAIVELAKNSGFSEDSSCSTYLGYNVLNNRTNFCFPDDIDEGFTTSFNKEFDHYLEFYKKVYLPKNNYGVSLIQGLVKLNVIGIANQDLKIQIVAKDIVPSFCPIPEDLAQLEDEDIICRTTYSYCNINKEVLEKLKDARSITKEKGYDLLVTSATRNLQHQQALFDKYGSSRAAFPKCTAPHISGKAVDVVLTKNGKPAAGMSSGDGKMSDLSIGERGELQNIMCKAGFQRYSGEFWHYEYKTNRWKDPEGVNCVLT